MNRLSSCILNRIGNSDKNAKEQIEWPPIDAISVEFVIVWELGTVKRRCDISELESFYDTIIKQLQQKVDKNLTLLTDPISPRSLQERKSLRVTRMINKRLKRMREIKIEEIRRGGILTSQLREFAKWVDTHAYPISVDVSRFKVMVLGLRKKNPELVRLKKEIRSLRVHAPTPEPRHSVTKEMLVSCAKRTLSLVDKSVWFVTESKFDHMFRDYIAQSPGYIKRYEEMISLFRNFEYARAFDLLVKVAREIEVEIELGSTLVEKFVLYCAALRLLFDQVVTEVPGLMNNDMSSTKFKKNCEKMRKSTPKEIDDNTDMFLPRQWNMPIAMMFSMDGDKDLADALEIFRSVQFLSTPWDIAMCLSEVLRIGCCHILSNRYRKKHFAGAEDREVPTHELSRFSSLSCDDRITFMRMILGADPPANATALRVFIRLLDRLVIDPNAREDSPEKALENALKSALDSTVALEAAILSCMQF